MCPGKIFTISILLPKQLDKNFNHLFSMLTGLQLGPIQGCHRGHVVSLNVSHGLWGFLKEVLIAKWKWPCPLKHEIPGLCKYFSNFKFDTFYITHWRAIIYPSILWLNINVYFFLHGNLFVRHHFTLYLFNKIVLFIITHMQMIVSLITE